MLTEQQKKYLITIYLLGQNGERVRTTDIADYLHVAKASAVKMCKKLIEEELIFKEPYRQIALTKKGVLTANDLFTSSVILKEFFTARVGMTDERAGVASMIISAELDKEALDKLVGFALLFK